MAIYFPPVSGQTIKYDDSWRGSTITPRQLLEKSLNDPSNEDIFVFIVPVKNGEGYKYNGYIKEFQQTIAGLEQHICMELTGLSNYAYPTSPGKISVCIMTRGGRENKSRVKLLESKVN